MLPWSQSSLLLVAHGSRSYPDAADGLRRLQGRIRAQALFDRVDLAFWHQEPMLSPASLQGRQVFVLPYFAGLGKHTETLIPERLGLQGAVTEQDGRRILYCQPVGCHSRLPLLIGDRAAARCRQEGLDPSATTLLLVAHGSRQGGAGKTPAAIADRLRQIGAFAEIVTAFLEQMPFAADWPALVDRPQVIAQPLLLSAGMHASEDLPALFGSRPSHRVWLQDGIGSDDEILAMMLDQIGAMS